MEQVLVTAACSAYFAGLLAASVLTLFRLVLGRRP